MLWINRSSPPSNNKPSRIDAPILSVPIGTFASLIRRQLPVFFVMVPCAMALGLVYLLTTPSSYTAVAKMVLDTRKVPAFQQQQLIGDAIDSTEVGTQVDVLTSENVSLAVIKALKLTKDPEFVGPGTGLFSAIFNLISSIFNSRSAESQEQRALARFEANLTVRRHPLTYTMEISFRSLDPGKAAQIANAIVDAYIADQSEGKYQSTWRASKWLLDRTNSLRDQASADLKALVEFKQRNNLVASDGKLINEQQMSEVNSQLILAHAATAEAKARLDLIQEVMSQDTPNASAVEALKSEVIIKLRQQYLEIAGRESILAKKYGPDHLAAVALRNQMFELRRNIADEMGRIAQSYKSEYEVALTRETSLQKSLTGSVAESRVTGHAQIELQELESNAKTSRIMYDNFLQRYVEAVQQQSFPVSDARLISVAIPPLKRSQPNTLIVLAITTVGGMMAAFAVAALREASDNVFRTSAKVEDVLHVKCIAMLPRLKPVAPDANDKEENTAAAFAKGKVLHQVIDAPFSQFTESLRSLKVIVDLNSGGETKRVIGVTSSLPNEGKSAIAANFSALIAHSGSRVILVDADLRNPSISQHLGPAATIGLVDVATGRAALNDAIWTDPTSGLTFLAAGPHSTKLLHPNEFLGSIALKSLIDKLRGSYDYVVVDLPPLAPVVDTRMTTGCIDSYVYVVEWGRTKVDVVQHSLSNAREIYDRLLGVVLNKVDLSVLERYERHRTDYYYRQFSPYKDIK
jgi:polysaccharide biosynthesis transport protein